MILSVDSYLNKLDARLLEDGFVRCSSPKMYYRSSFSIGELNTVCFVKNVRGNLTVDIVKEFSKNSYELAVKSKGGIFSQLIIYPLLITDQVPYETQMFIRKYTPKHWASFEFPVIIDLSSEELSFGKSTPIWGGLYYPRFREEAKYLFEPRSSVTAASIDKETGKIKIQEIETKKPKGPFKTLVIALLTIVFSLTGLFDSILEVDNELVLQKEGTVTQATVTDADFELRSGNRIKYWFEVNNEIYWYNDSISRNYYKLTQQKVKDPTVNWASIPLQTWKDAQELKHIEILYLPSDPWINRPLDLLEGYFFSPMTTHIFGIVLFSVLILIGISLIINDLILMAGLRTIVVEKNQTKV